MQPATEAAALECAGKPRIDLTGRRYGKLIVIGFAGRRRTETGQTMMWTCLCDCGVARPVSSNQLGQGKATQCMECFRRSNPQITHGLSHHPLYATWVGMKQRCSDPANPGYKNYGGRGIKVCKRWSDSFEAFLEDMGEKPSPNLSIDRINNDGDYEPENCRWATQKEQCRNTRWARLIPFNGETLTITEWADRLGITRERLRQRLQTRSIEEALTCKKNESPPRVSLNASSKIPGGRPRLGERRPATPLRCSWIPVEWLDGTVRRIDRGTDFAPPADNVAGMIRDRAELEGDKAVTRIIDDTILFKVIKQTA